jgi:hypothetical protein
MNMNITDLFAQLPALPSGALETWVLCALALLPAFALARKFFNRKSGDPQPPGHVTHVELNAVSKDLRRELDRLRDRIDARFLGVSEKVEQLRTELLAAEERRAEALHDRLNDLEAGLARLDERTRH